jgi:hypothetical protein
MAMMIFVGFLMGIYIYINDRFIDPASVQAAVEVTAGMFPNVPPEQMKAAEKAMTNPMVLVFAGILQFVFFGTIIGLISGFLTKKDPMPQSGNDNPAEDGK